MNTRLALIVVCAYSFVLDASQVDPAQALTTRCKQRESVYCSALQCWSQTPCLQHPKNNAQSVWHDAQRCLKNPDLLHLIGLYALPEHTHVIQQYPFVQTEMRNFLAVRPSWQCLYVHVFHEIRSEHYKTVYGLKVVKEGVDLSDDNTYTNILRVDSRSKTVATVALTQDQKNFFRKMNLQQRKAICSKTAGNRIDVLLNTESEHSFKDKMCLVPAVENSVLEQASFLEYHSKTMGKKK